MSIPIKCLTGEVFTEADALGIGTPVISPAKNKFGIGVGDVNPRWYPGLDKQNNMIMSYGTKIFMESQNTVERSSFGFEEEDFVVRVNGKSVMRINSFGATIAGILENTKTPTEFINESSGLSALLYPNNTHRTLSATFTRPMFAGYHYDSSTYVAYREISSFLTKFDGTFTRNSVATYYNDRGVLKQAEPNEPRLGHKPYSRKSRGILIETPSQNLITSSYTLTDWTNLNLPLAQSLKQNWFDAGLSFPYVIKQGADASAVEHSITRTFTGVLNKNIAASFFFSFETPLQVINYATLFVANSDRTKVFGVNLTFAIDGSITKANRIAGTGAVIDYEIERITDKIYRCKLLGILDFSSADNTNKTLSGVFATTDASFALTYQSAARIDWLALSDFQFEVSSRVTSYLKTGTTTVSRGSETLLLSLKNFKFDANEGSFDLEFMGRSLAIGTIVAQLQSADTLNRLEIFVSAVDTAAKTYTIARRVVIGGTVGTPVDTQVLPQAKSLYTFSYEALPSNLNQLLVTSDTGFTGSFLSIAYS